MWDQCGLSLWDIKRNKNARRHLSDESTMKICCSHDLVLKHCYFFIISPTTRTIILLTCGVLETLTTTLVSQPHSWGVFNFTFVTNELRPKPLTSWLSLLPGLWLLLSDWLPAVTSSLFSGPMFALRFSGLCPAGVRLVSTQTLPTLTLFTKVRSCCLAQWHL